jgi:hypothetical protein
MTMGSDSARDILTGLRLDGPHQDGKNQEEMPRCQYIEHNGLEEAMATSDEKRHQRDGNYYGLRSRL